MDNLVANLVVNLCCQLLPQTKLNVENISFGAVFARFFPLFFLAPSDNTFLHVLVFS